MTLTKARIAELRALLAKATPGPWGVNFCKYCPTGMGHLAIADDGRCSVDDARLIGVMRDVLPALLDALDEAGVLIEELLTLVDPARERAVDGTTTDDARTWLAKWEEKP